MKTMAEVRDWAARVCAAYDHAMARLRGPGGARAEPDVAVDHVARKVLGAAAAEDAATRRDARACVASALIAREMGADPADFIARERFWWSAV